MTRFHKAVTNLKSNDVISSGVVEILNIYIFWSCIMTSSVLISPLQCKSHFNNCIHEGITLAFNPQRKDPRLWFCNQTGTKFIFPSCYLSHSDGTTRVWKGCSREGQKAGGGGRNENEKSNKSKQMDINFTETALCQNVEPMMYLLWTLKRRMVQKWASTHSNRLVSYSFTGVRTEGSSHNSSNNNIANNKHLLMLQHSNSSSPKTY